MAIHAAMKSLKAVAAMLMVGALLIGPTHSGTVVRDHRGQNSDSNQIKPPKDTGWGNGSGAVRDHRKPPPFPCVVRVPGAPGC